MDVIYLYIRLCDNIKPLKEQSVTVHIVSLRKSVIKVNNEEIQSNGLTLNRDSCFDFWKCQVCMPRFISVERLLPSVVKQKDRSSSKKKEGNI